ncbi:MAG: ParB/RepB/Spo0J family partition protein [Bacteriovoracaceae bacterium]|nr:ParB/RepB/Spo0J family partition protein [Bacteriovoracaceae bacterium]
MAKTFAPRKSKRERKTINLSEKLGKDLFKKADDKLLKGARLVEVALKDVFVKEQVRTKFNDNSIKELAANIKSNGLIQPLVVHRDGTKFTLICGERRFRAMTSIEMEKAPCFVLEGKTEQELMAIQFSENSAREALHYIDKGDGIYNYQKATKASERKITQALGISKSEVHRSLMIARMPKKIKEAAKIYDIEKYVLLEWDALDRGKLKTEVQKKILSGELTKRSHLRNILKNGPVVNAGRKSAAKRPKKKPVLPPGLTANAFLKAMKSKTKDLDLDADTLKAIKALVKETSEVLDN